MSTFPQPVPARGFPDVYEELLWRILRRGVRERNRRTGREVAVFPDGCASFTLDMCDHNLPVIGRRKLYPASAAAEVAWQLMGTQDASFIMRYAPAMWGKFLEPQPPAQGLLVKAAYGYRWRTHFKRDQLLQAMIALEANPSDRRVYVSTWDPAADGLGEKGQLSVPCPVGFTLSVLDGRLNSTLHVRSSDVFVGLPYDVMGHSMLLAAMGETLGLRLGLATYALSHAHVYDSHYEQAGNMLLQGKAATSIALPRWTVEQVEAAPDQYVAKVRRDAAFAEWPEYAPKPEVVA